MIELELEVPCFAASKRFEPVESKTQEPEDGRLLLKEFPCF